MTCRSITGHSGTHGSVLGGAAASLGTLQALADIDAASSQTPAAAANQQTLDALTGAAARVSKIAGRAAAEMGLAMGLASMIGCKETFTGVPSGAISTASIVLEDARVTTTQSALQASFPTCSHLGNPKPSVHGISTISEDLHSHLPKQPLEIGCIFCMAHAGILQTVEQQAQIIWLLVGRSKAGAMACRSAQPVAFHDVVSEMLVRKLDCSTNHHPWSVLRCKAVGPAHYEIREYS